MEQSINQQSKEKRTQCNYISRQDKIGYYSVNRTAMVRIRRKPVRTEAAFAIISFKFNTWNISWTWHLKGNLETSKKSLNYHSTFRHLREHLYGKRYGWFERICRICWTISLAAITFSRVCAFIVGRARKKVVLWRKDTIPRYDRCWRILSYAV